MRSGVVLFGAIVVVVGITLGFPLKIPIGCPITLLGLGVFVLGLFLRSRDE